MLNGEGIRKATFLRLKVYKGSLFATKKLSSNDEVLANMEPMKIKMEFLRDVSKEKIVTAWKEGLKSNNPSLGSSLDNQFVELTSILPTDFNKGDFISLDFTSDSVTLNASPHLTKNIIGEEFRTALLRVWFGPEPPDEDLIKGMLGISQ